MNLRSSLVTATLCLSQISLPTFGRADEIAPPPAAPARAPAEVNPDRLSAADLKIIELSRRRTPEVRAIERVMPAVVNIDGEKALPGVQQAGEPQRMVNTMGSGVVLDSRGYIVTNAHVVVGLEEINVTLFDGKRHLASIVFSDQPADVAVIKIRSDKPFAEARLGTSRDLMVGEPTISVGNPFGYNHTVCRGIVSALHRNVQASDVISYYDLIQTDAAINPGSSGGALININGEVIGICVAERGGANNIGFALPIDAVLKKIEGTIPKREQESKAVSLR